MCLNTTMENLDYLNQRASRQVTSLSYDVVDSSGQMAALGVENYALWLEKLHLAYKAVAMRWEGIVDVAQGDDGCMCYFGAVTSAEHARESALFAALEMRDLALASGWAIRFGVAYGPSSVYQEQPYGPSVHLAARLQKLALNCQIMVSSDLVELVTHKFVCTDLFDLPAIKGFPLGLQAAQLLTNNSTMRKLPVPVSSGSSSKNKYLIGRQQTLMQLGRSWSVVQKNLGHDVRISGGAGVGKTTLVNALIHNINPPEDAVFFLRFFPENRHIPFAPLSNIVSSWLRLSLSDTEVERENKLQEFGSKFSWVREHDWALRHLIGLKSASANSPIEDPLSSQQKLIQAMVDWFARVASKQSILIVFEDFQWADAATSLFIERLRGRLKDQAIMLLVTQRSGDEEAVSAALVYPWTQTIDVEALTFEESAALIDQIGSDLKLDLDMIAMLQERSQGIPLFIEENIKLIRKPDAQIKIRAAKNLNLGFPVPSGVQELFMQKLDNLGAARALAQVCSALGTEFNVALMNAVMAQFAPHLSQAVVADMVAILLAEGVLSRRESAVQSVYVFKHALIQDTAYQSMWETDKKKLHTVVAQVLVAQFGQLTLSQPHLIARHYFLAEQFEQALVFYMKAADLYKQAGSHIACISVLEFALSCVDFLAVVESTLRSKVSIRLQLAGQILLTQGYGDQRVGESYADALKLGQTLGDHGVIFKSHLGLHSYFLMRGQLDLAEQQIELARVSASSKTREFNQLLCDFAQAMGYFYRGHIQVASEWMASCERQSNQLALTTKLTHNPGILSAVYRAFCLWIEGQTEHAVVVMWNGVGATEAMSSKLAAVQAKGIQAMLMYCRGDFLLAQTCGQSAIDIGRDGPYALWLDLARFMQAAASLQLAVKAKKPLADAERALAKMVEAYDDWVSKSAKLTQPFYLCILAQCQMLLKDHEAAKKRLELAMELINEHQERYFAPELLRTRAVLYIKMRLDEGWLSQARTLLNLAYCEARDKGLHSFALRTALSMHECEIEAGNEVDVGDAGETFTWCDGGLTSRELLAESLSLIEANSTTLDAITARELLAVKTQLERI